jgi:hypothetical protein
MMETDVIFGGFIQVTDAVIHTGAEHASGRKDRHRVEQFVNEAGCF